MGKEELQTWPQTKVAKRRFACGSLRSVAWTQDELNGFTRNVTCASLCALRFGCD